eukprot:7204476-Prymnesium_polylepis.2
MACAHPNMACAHPNMACTHPNVAGRGLASRLSPRRATSGSSARCRRNSPSCRCHLWTTRCCSSGLTTTPPSGAGDPPT